MQHTKAKSPASFAELLEKLCMALPIASNSPTESPVETKGYKNIVKLPDWLFQHNIFVKSEKPYQNGRIYLLESCPFSSDHKDGAYAIQFANGAIHAGCHHAKSGGGKQRWKDLREHYETNEDKLKCREEWLIARKREWTRAKVAAEVPEYRIKVPINRRLVYTIRPWFRPVDPKVTFKTSRIISW